MKNNIGMKKSCTWLAVLLTGLLPLQAQENTNNTPRILGFICCDYSLRSLDVSGCTALMSLGCWGNRNLSSLDVSGCPALTSLDCSYNYMISI